MCTSDDSQEIDANVLAMALLVREEYEALVTSGMSRYEALAALDVTRSPSVLMLRLKNLSDEEIEAVRQSFARLRSDQATEEERKALGQLSDKLTRIDRRLRAIFEGQRDNRRRRNDGTVSADVSGFGALIFGALIREAFGS